MRSIILMVVACFSILFISCNDQVVYSAYEDIPDGMWYVDNTPTFKIEIKDTTQKYKVFYLVRNSLQYPYYNLYISKKIKDPDGKQISNMLDELFITNETTGKPYGKGIGDLFDHKVLILNNYTFHKEGIYEFKFTQFMRQNPLPFILSMGVSVEKVEAKN